MAGRNDTHWATQLGAPSMFTEVPRVDALGTLALAHLTPPPALCAPVPDPSLPLPPAVEAAEEGKFRALAACARVELERLAGTFSSVSQAGTALAMLHWWEVRLAALVRLRDPSLIVTEDENLWSVLSRIAWAPSKSAEPRAGEDSPRLLSSSPLIPFSLRVMHARAPRLVQDLSKALVRVSELRGYALGEARRLSHPDPSDLMARTLARRWYDRARRISLVLVGLLLESRDPRGALAALHETLVPSLEQEASAPDDAWVLCIAARMHIVLGLVSEAERICARAAQVAEAQRGQVLQRRHSQVASAPSQSETAARHADDDQYHALARLTMRIDSVRALILVARGDAAQAREVLCAGADHSTTDGDNEDLQAEVRVLKANASTTAFLAGHLGTAAQEAWHLLAEEELPSLSGVSWPSGPDPGRAGTDLSPRARATAGATALVFNAATYAELAADNALDAKRSLLRTVAARASDGARVSAFKLT